MVGAGIVTFNPNLKRLKENIDSIYFQVSKMVIVDNGSNNIDQILEMVKVYKNISVVKNDENKGIARALNQIVEYANENGLSWILTLDQDSVCDENIIENYIKYKNYPNVAMITGKKRDRNFGYESSDMFTEDYVLIDCCITSGCLTNVDACIKVGGFDEQMFIDYVDFDMCFTLKENGYELLKVNYTGILHELGNSKKKKILGREVLITNHSAIRRYYFSRNVIYFARKHKKYINRWVYYSKIITRLAIVILYEKDKYKKTKAGLKGIVDGLKMKNV